MPKPVLSDLEPDAVLLELAMTGFGSPGCKGERRRQHQTILCTTREEWVRLTCLFREPTRSLSRVSRASSLWPTSSNASVASWPPTSSITSSPPLLAGAIVSTGFIKEHASTRKQSLGATNSAGWGEVGDRNLRVLVDELAGIVDLVVDDEVEILLGVVLGNVVVGQFLRHFGGFWAGAIPGAAAVRVKKRSSGRVMEVAGSIVRVRRCR